MFNEKIYHLSSVEESIAELKHITVSTAGTHNSAKHYNGTCTRVHNEMWATFKLICLREQMCVPKCFSFVVLHVTFG